MNLILISLLTLVLVGALSAIILFFVSKKFEVFEDPRINEVEAALPAANCGACGFPGCRGFANACVKAHTLENLLCPVGGKPTMEKVAAILGQTAPEISPLVAVVRCVSSCAIAHNLYGGETACSWGCLGLGDCVVSCKFDAIFINPETLLPEVDENKCTSCGACVKACPKLIIELRKKGPASHRIIVNCINEDKGAVNKKACSVACIGCSKCFKECAFDAITMKTNLAYIDAEKCTLCGKCVNVCPTAAIVEINK